MGWFTKIWNIRHQLVVESSLDRLVQSAKREEVEKLQERAAERRKEFCDRMTELGQLSRRAANVDLKARLDEIADRICAKPFNDAIAENAPNPNVPQMTTLYSRVKIELEEEIVAREDRFSRFEPQINPNGVRVNELLAVSALRLDGTTIEVTLDPETPLSERLEMMQSIVDTLDVGEQSKSIFVEARSSVSGQMVKHYADYSPAWRVYIATKYALYAWADFISLKLLLKSFKVVGVSTETGLDTVSIIEAASPDNAAAKAAFRKIKVTAVVEDT